MSINQSGWFALDVESGGLDPNENPILTFCGIIVDNDLLPLELPLTLKILPAPGKIITKESLNINKINIEEHKKTAISIEQASKQLYDYLEPYTSYKHKLGLIGQNINFDKGFMEVSGLMSHWGKFFNRESLDTKVIASFLKLSKKLPNDLETNLVKLAQYFNISTEKAHDAEGDVFITLEVLSEMRKLING